MERRDYEILSGDTLVATWRGGNLEVLDHALLPLYLKRIQHADMWLETRAIDSHRSNSRLLKKALRLAEKDDVSTVIRQTKWAKPKPILQAERENRRFIAEGSLFSVGIK